MNSTTTAPTERSFSSMRAIGRALDIVGGACVWDADETAITDAITDLLHLAWVATNDDGEAVNPYDVIDAATSNFEAERDGGDGLAHSDGTTEQQHLESRKAALCRALNFVQARLDGAPARSVDMGHSHGPNLCAPPVNR